MNTEEIKKEIDDIEILDLETPVLEPSEPIGAEIEEETVLEKNVKPTHDIHELIKTARQLRAEKLVSMEEEMNTMEDTNYKKKQLEMKIADKKKRWFPKVFWYSAIKGTYKKLKKEDVQIGLPKEEIETQEKIID